MLFDLKTAPRDRDAQQKGIKQLREALTQADAVVIGAGAGLSTAAGFAYSGKRFEEWFPGYKECYGFADMYAGGFYPYQSLEEFWAYWSRSIMANRYTPAPTPLYDELLKLVQGRDYFVVTTNVDHQFQLAGFDKHRLYYTQGDYGLFQCSVPCHNKTYDNEEAVRAMFEQQHNFRIPSELVPKCPVCGRPMTTNLRCDDTFVEDEGWHKAHGRYQDFLRRHQSGRVLYLELGVGWNTPGIIKLPFWQKVAANPQATYACVNFGEASAPEAIARRSILIDDDIAKVVQALG